MNPVQAPGADLKQGVLPCPSPSAGRGCAQFFVASLVITDAPSSCPSCISPPAPALTSQPDRPGVGVLAKDGTWAAGGASEVEDDPDDDDQHHDCQQEEDVVVVHGDLLKSPAAHQRAGQQGQVHGQQDGEHAAALLPHFLGGRSGGGLVAERSCLARSQAGFVVLVSAAHAGVGVSELAVLLPGLLGHGSTKALPEGESCWEERPMSERCIWNSPGLAKAGHVMRRTGYITETGKADRECKKKDELIFKFSFPGSLKAFFT